MSNLLSLGRADLENTKQGEINLTGAGEGEKRVSSHLNPESEALADGLL